MKAFLFWTFLLLFSLPMVLAGCSTGPERKVQRAFYYWRSSFQLDSAERKALTGLHCRRLYVKFFDVTWNEESQAPQPAAQIRFSEKPPAGLTITPVVFITHETLRHLAPMGIPELARHLARLTEQLALTHGLRLSNEVQIDCDWTAATRTPYFRLLQALRREPFFRHKTFSATIRLHQLKYISQNGIPPVDKGLLMCYNMGNLRRPETGNSIIETTELQKYIRNLDSYPLPLDVALPLFDWYVWFRGRQYQGLFHSYQLPDAGRRERRIVFTRDTVVNGYAFTKGDWLRYEGSPPAALMEAAKLLDRKLRNKEISVIFYHLDRHHLNRYQPYELENIFDRFR
ncbi:hypothetical protein V9K67_07345 [Paraflavisolibacter sp. H34]|uniref:hypothetical protein n=1 Tax=Huijunlia imazamoxiresistens TaxID=3127457 RepID=UPI0030189A28